MSKLQLYLTSFLLVASFIVNSATKDQIDDLMLQAFKLMVKKDFKTSHNSYLKLLAHEESMSLSQRTEIYYSLLELSYILDSEDEARKYGIKLISLIKDEADYDKIYERLKYRICSSQDWAKFQSLFSEYCV